MAKKTFRRTVASILAVLAVTGNAIAPVGTGVLLAETAIVAEAVDSSSVVLNEQGYAFDAKSGTLFINGVIRTRDSGEDQRIDLRNKQSLFEGNNTVTGLGYNLSAEEIKN